MTREVVAILTGFTKNAELSQRSLAPLRTLRRAGIIDRILYVTWSAAGIDPYVEPLGALDDVEIVRVPQPEISASPVRAGMTYQIRNLEAALACVANDDALIVKLRPDFVFDEDFLTSKILGFARLCAPSDLGEAFGAAMPPSPFSAKIWVPWANASQPLHLEDAAFIGVKRDIEKLANRDAETLSGTTVLSANGDAWLSHAVRYAAVFLPSYPIFAGYIRNYRYFVNDPSFRAVMMTVAVKQTFFWRLIAANAWILATSFHVDCGVGGELEFYANASNRNANWPSLCSLRIHPPYNAVDEWRLAQRPGGLLPCVGRMHARLVDDSWQHALFAGSDLTDMACDRLRGLLHESQRYRHDVPDVAEVSFYDALDNVWRSHFEARAVSA